MKAKIQGQIGRRKGRVGILQIALNPEKWAAVEKFKIDRSEVITFIQTPIPHELLREPKKRDRFLAANRDAQGFYVEEDRYLQGVKSSYGFAEEQRTARDLHEYSSEISGDLHRKSMARVRRIIDLNGQLDHEFIQELLR